MCAHSKGCVAEEKNERTAAGLFNGDYKRRPLGRGPKAAPGERPAQNKTGRKRMGKGGTKDEKWEGTVSEDPMGKKK